VLELPVSITLSIPVYFGENKHRYPKDWPAIRARILKRAGNNDVRSTPTNGRRAARMARPCRADSVAKLPKCRAANFPQIDQTSRNRRAI
jgi:hypothetical protein